MFFKLSLLFLVIRSINALTLNTPTGVTSGGSVTLTWTTATGDPSVFSVELTHPSFNNAIAIANNVPSASGTLTVTIPIVAAESGYTIEFVDIGNINNIFATSGSFTIGATSTASTSSTSALGTTSVTSASSASGKSTTGTSLTTPAVATTTGFGTTATATTHASTSSGSSTSTSSASSGATTSKSAAPMTFALPTSNVAAIAVAFMAAVGGAAAFVL